MEQFRTSWNSGEASQNRSESIDVCPLSGSVSTHLLACVLCSACFFALRVFVCVVLRFEKLCLLRLFIPVHVFSTLHRAVCVRERERYCGGRFCWVIQSELSSSVQKKHDVRTLPNCCIVGFSVSLNYILRFLPQACGVSLPWVAFLMLKLSTLGSQAAGTTPQRLACIESRRRFAANVRYS